MAKVEEVKTEIVKTVEVEDLISHPAPKGSGVLKFPLQRVVLTNHTAESGGMVGGAKRRMIRLKLDEVVTITNQDDYDKLVRARVIAK